MPLTTCISPRIVILAETNTPGGGAPANVTRTVAVRVDLAKETETVGFEPAWFTAGAASTLDPLPTEDASAKAAIATVETIDADR